jgi:DNA repair/transcription protein MET18/MMS19
MILLRKSALEGLVSIAKLTRKPIEEITLPLLFGKLPETAPALDDEAKRLEYKHILSSVSVLCALPGLLEMMILRILTRLENMATSGVNQSADSTGLDVDAVARECNAAYAYSLLHSLLVTIRRKVQEGHHDVAKHFDTIVPRLFDFFVTGAVSGNEDPIRTDPRLLSAAASIIETITQTLAKEYVDSCRIVRAQLIPSCLSGARSASRRSYYRRISRATSKRCFRVQAGLYQITFNPSV